MTRIHCLPKDESANEDDFPLPVFTFVFTKFKKIPGASPVSYQDYFKKFKVDRHKSQPFIIPSSPPPPPLPQVIQICKVVPFPIAVKETEGYGSKTLILFILSFLFLVRYQC